MTMLDRMRGHKNWLKWSLVLIVLAFVIAYIPDFVSNPNTDLAASDTVAIVNGEEIKGHEFRRTYQAQMQAYRQAYGGNLNDQLLKQLGVDQQILQQLVDERAALAEAQSLGIRVSDQEVAQRIYAIPAFQENGAFIGAERYQQLLRMQNPPLSAAEFEDTIRRALIVEKLRSSVTEWLSIPDPDVEAEYRRRNDKVKLAVVAFLNDSFRPDVSATDAELTAYFDGHKEEFRIPEKRKIKYLLVDVDALRAKVAIAPGEIERAYNDNFEQYSTPEQIRASHILLKTEGKDEAAVRARAEDLLKQARAGADFAALAKAHSEDEGSASKGGDLDFFGRGRMVPEFDDAAFKLEAGQISDLVKTQYGFHVIKVVEKRPGTMRPIEEVRAQLTEQLSFERAQAQAADLADRLQQQITKPADLETVGQANGLQVQETSFFARSEPIVGLGASPEIAARTFEMAPGEVSGAIRTGRGFVFATMTERQDPYIPGIEEVRERVRDVVIRQKAQEFGRRKAEELLPRLRNASDFTAAAKAGGVTAETTELITRDAPLPQLAMAAAVSDAAFKLPQGAVSDPIATDNGVAIVKVLEKAEVTETDLTANKDRFRSDLLADRKNRFFSAYMEKAKEKMKIEVNRQALQRLVG